MLVEIPRRMRTPVAKEGSKWWRERWSHLCHFCYMFWSYCVLEWPSVGIVNARASFRQHLSRIFFAQQIVVESSLAQLIVVEYTEMWWEGEVDGSHLFSEFVAWFGLLRVIVTKRKDVNASVTLQFGNFPIHRHIADCDGLPCDVISLLKKRKMHPSLKRATRLIRANKDNRRCQVLPRTMPWTPDTSARLGLRKSGRRRMTITLR